MGELPGAQENRMPANKDLKRLIRARAARTGETYSTARARILAAGSGRSPLMRFESSTSGGRRITAFNAPADYAPLLRGIGFEPDAEATSFTWRFPDDAPSWEAVARNWPAQGRQFIDQVVGVELPDWPGALEWIADAAEDVGADWFLLGSAGLAVRGVDVRPGGVDIGMDEAGADRLGARAVAEVMQPIAPTHGWPVSTRYGRLFHAAPIQVVGGILDRDWPSPWDSQGRGELDSITWRDRTIRVTSLDREVQHARRMARYDHARAIVRYRAESGTLH
jgi:hypothetical protein